MFHPNPRSVGGRDAAPLARRLADAARAMEVRLEGIADSIIHGDRLSGFPGRGLEAVGVREYQHGDEARGIDWRVTARKGRLHVKEFAEERDLPFLLLLHRSPTLGGGRSGIKETRALEVAGILSAVALKGGDRVGILQGGGGRGGFLSPARSSTQLLHLLSSLLDPPEAAFREPLTELLALAARLAGERHRIFLIADFRVAEHSAFEMRKGLARLVGRHALTPVRITDGREAVFPCAFPALLRDPRDRRLHRPARGGGRNDLRTALDREDERVGEMLRELGLREWRVEVDAPLVPTLRTHMARERWGGGGRV